MKTILIVEDEALIALAQKRSLEKYGYRVLAVYTGEEAVDFAQKSSDIDLILMDIDLGQGIDGTEAAERILSEHDIPIVFLSSHTEPEVVEKTEKITSYGYVVKNSSITVLDASIKMAFKLFDANQKTKQINIKLETTLNTLSDITDTDTVQTELKKSRSRYQTLFEYSPISIWEEDFSEVKKRFDGLRPEAQGKWKEYFDAHGEKVAELAELVKVVDINRTGVSFFGAHDKKELFVSIMTYFSPESLETFKKELIALAEGHTHFETEISIPGYGGIQKYLFLRLLVAPGSEQSLSCVLLSFIDITERKHAETALRKKNEELEKNEIELKRQNSLFSALLHNIPIGVFMVESPSGKPLFANEKAEELFGRDVLPDVSRDSLCAVYPSYQKKNHQFYPVEKRPIILGMKGLASHIDDMIVERPDGSERLLEVFGSPVQDEKGEVWASIVSLLDITERAEAEDRIKTLLSEKELILKEVHHRIKNNLTTIDSFLSLQAETLGDPEAIGALEEAGNRVKSMAVLYDSLYQSADFSEMSIAKYLPLLIDEIMGNFPNARSIALVNHFDDFMLDAKTLQTLGIIINELLTNIMKYAFKI